MPQMMPMYWLMLALTLTGYVLILISFMFFLVNYKMISPTHTPYSRILMDWSWMW